jgi:peptidoglycan/LPS O-acetylase OafA/YrhL
MDRDKAASAAHRNERLVGIQFARGVAAFIVVLYHSGRMISLPQYVGYIPLRGIFNFGHAGVDFFFVLSGFIIFYVHRGDIGSASALPRYLVRRITRIYPPYWIVTAFVVALALAAHGHVDLTRLALSLSLLPQQEEPLLGVAWTLEQEVLFYVVFALAIMSRRLGIAVFAAWMLFVAVASFFDLHWLLAFVGSAYNAQFLMGAIAAAVATRGLPRPLLLTTLGATVFVVIGMVENAGLIDPSGIAGRLLYGPAAMLLVIGIAAAERQGGLRIGRIGAFFGDMSYSTYLVHTVVIGLTARVLMMMGLIKLTPGWVVMILVIISALGIAALLYRFVERPVTRALNQLARHYVLAPVRPERISAAP